MNSEWLGYRDLMDYNVAGKKIRDLRRVLIYGTCVRDEHPEIFREFVKDRVPLAVCLEYTHFNMVALKLASMFARVKLEEVVVLTVDGSPHCVQLHHAVEEARRVVGDMAPRVEHYVIESDKAVKVSERAVKTARYLSKIDAFLHKTF